MGLADRDYARAPAPSFRPIGVRGRSPLSATVWLVVVCVGVFFLDNSLPRVAVQFSELVPLAGRAQMLADLQKSKAESTVIQGPVDARGVGSLLLYPGKVDPRVVLARRVEPIAVGQYRLAGPISALLEFTTAQAVGWIDVRGEMTGLQFLRFLGYGFLHVNLTHLLLNMLGLWMFGPIIEQAFGRRRFFAIFSVGVIAGALLFLLLNAAGIAFARSGTSVPGLLSNDPWTPLIGASAGVYAIIISAARLRPNEEVVLLGIVPMRLRTLAFGMIAIAIWTLLTAGSNAGGEAAHLGGAIAGWWIVQRPHLVDDFFDLFGRRVSPRSTRPLGPAAARSAPSVAEVDRILDKVRASGVHSLTARERATLEAASRAANGGGRRG